MPTPFDAPLYPYQRSADQDASTPPRHPVVVIGAGPIGLALAIDLAINDVPVLVLDDSDRVGDGSRAICFAKRSLEILDRLGVGEILVEKGVTWSRGKVFFGERQVYQFDLLPEDDHRRPAFINLQQYYLEAALIERLQELQRSGKPVQLRGRNRLVGLTIDADHAGHDDHVSLRIDTPDGPYALDADWLIACDGAGSTVRRLMDLDFEGRVFEDNFLIADVVMKADFPTERWFWFDPPFNRGQSALLHKQPDDVWRIDLQLGRGVDKQEEKRSENVIPRLKTMLGDDVAFELEWVSIYTFQCRRMKRFRHGPVLFAGDSAHQVSPFGARGANSGLQDTDDLAWRLKLVIDRVAGDQLLDRYDIERVQAADENILNSTRSTDFITPKSHMSRVFRDAVLDLSASARVRPPAGQFWPAVAARDLCAGGQGCAGRSGAHPARRTRRRRAAERWLAALPTGWQVRAARNRQDGACERGHRRHRGRDGEHRHRQRPEPGAGFALSGRKGRSRLPRPPGSAYLGALADL